MRVVGMTGIASPENIASVSNPPKEFPACNSPRRPTIPFPVEGVGNRHPTDGPQGRTVE